MARNNIIDILKEVVGDTPLDVNNNHTSGIYWDVTINDYDGNPGIHGDIVAKHTAITAIDGTASASADAAELSAWDAEAEKMTADSYATEAEDVFVKTYASDGDGTFTDVSIQSGIADGQSKGLGVVF